jgi:Cytochrome c554 and c-prime
MPMTRTNAPHRYRPLAAVGLVVGLLAHVGCNASKPGDAPAPSPSQGAAANAPAVPAPEAAAKPTEAGAPKLEAKDAKPPGREPFADWPTPAGAVLISGEQLGYLEPCGCTSGQQGGLLRRYELATQIRDQKKWPLALVDLGSLIKDPVSARGGPEQSKLKFNIALKALGVLKYDALALSAEDLELGVDEAVGQFLNLPGDRLRIVAANVVMPGLETKVVPSVKTTAGPVKLGITAVVDPDALKALKDPSLDLLQVKPIDQALPGVLADLEKSTDTQILLVQAPPETAKALAAKYPGFDIVVGTSVYADPPEDAERLNDGKTLLVTVGHKGKCVGVVGLFPGATPAYRYQRVRLDQVYDGPAKPMKDIIEGEFRETLKQQKAVENYPKHGHVAGAGDASGATFVGVDACEKCHPATVESWRETKHAHAFASLEKDPKPNTIFDVECISCHTVGFEYTSGYKSAALTPLLKNVQCENCHGPGSKHVAEPTVKAHRIPMRVTREQADKNRLCYQCHDEDNSPKFNFAEYWEDVDHNGLDDPREHLDPADKAKLKAEPAAAK